MKVKKESDEKGWKEKQDERKKETEKINIKE